jgi:hypothetical protein
MGEKISPIWERRRLLEAGRVIPRGKKGGETMVKRFVVILMLAALMSLVMATGAHVASAQDQELVQNNGVDEGYAGYQGIDSQELLPSDQVDAGD